MIIYDMTLYWRLLAYALLVGTALGALYDVFRLTRLFLSIPTKIFDLQASNDTREMHGTEFEDGDYAQKRLPSKSTKAYKTTTKSPLLSKKHSIKIQKTSSANADLADHSKAEKIVKATNEAVIFVVAMVEDIVFLTVSAIVISIFLFNFNTGSTRFFLIAGVAIGFAAYLFSVGRLTWMVGGAIVSAVRFAVSTILKLLKLFAQRVLLPPAHFVMSICTKIFIKLCEIDKKLWEITFGKMTEKRIEHRKAIEKKLEEERIREEALRVESERIALEARLAEERIQRKNRARADGFCYSGSRRG